jgi:hypothetical protein
MPEDFYLPPTDYAQRNVEWQQRVETGARAMAFLECAELSPLARETLTWPDSWTRDEQAAFRAKAATVLAAADGRTGSPAEALRTRIRELETQLNGSVTI